MLDLLLAFAGVLVLLATAALIGVLFRRSAVRRRERR